MTTATLFPGFEARRIATSGTDINLILGGSGPPLLLLHGYPQTHAMWHRLAPRLAQHFTVVCADMRGYGDSGKPASEPDHRTYSKRAMAQDQVEVMQALGFERFALAAHDRGGRVAHRMARDHAERIERLALLDISPTAIMYAETDKVFATAYYHWFFLIQPYDLPERLIGADPAYYLRKMLGGFGSSGLAIFDARAYAEYERCFSDPATIHATCEDYRAAATIDLEHDAADAGRKIDCPVLVLWGEKGVVHRLFDPVADWKSVASDVRGKALPSGHYLAEDAPEVTYAALLAFLQH